MVETATKLSLRGQRQRERLQKIHSVRPQGGVRVTPTDEKYRSLRHPNGMAFRPDGDIEWPNDRFTKRRIQEGVVKLVGEKPKRAPQRQRADAESSS